MMIGWQIDSWNCMITRKDKIMKKHEEYLQHLFTVKNDEEGWAFIKQARKSLQSGCSLILKGRGSRVAAVKQAIEDGVDVAYGFQSSLPLKYATEFKVYLAIATPTDLDIPWSRPGDYRIYGPKNILKSFKKKECNKCGNRIYND